MKKSLLKSLHGRNIKKQLLSAIICLFSLTVCYGQGPYLVGMTLQGGSNQNGNIFKWDVSGTTLFKSYEFLAGGDGDAPWGSPMQAKNGLFYGFTRAGGTAHEGVLFSYDATNDSEKVLHSFAGGTGGAAPIGAPIQLPNGLLYGLVSSGGTSGTGMIYVYNITADSGYTAYSFASDTSDASYPNASLMQASDSLLYGMSPLGGNQAKGALFSFNAVTGVERKVYDFGFGADAASPYGSLIQVGDSLLFGLASAGGSTGHGAIFSYNIVTGTETLLYSFAGYPADGSSPYGSLLAKNGLLYGLTNGGGSIGNGTVFSYNPATGTEKDIYNFQAGNDGRRPSGSLMQASDGKLYGMASAGGSGFDGMIFSFNTTDSTYADGFDFNGINGYQPEYGALVEYIPVVSGIKEVASPDEIKVFPNPSNGGFNIALSPAYKQCSVKVYNLTGEIIYDSFLSPTENKIDLSNEPSGVYAVHILTANGIQVQKAVLVR